MTIPLVGMIGTNETMTAMTLIAGNVTTIVEIATMIAETVSAPGTAPVARRTRIVKPRTTGTDAMRTESGARTSVKMVRTAKRGKVCLFENVHSTG